MGSAAIADSAASKRGRTPSVDVERELVAAAETVLAREGPDAVTVRAVAAEAGVAPMSVYNRFGSKDGLVEALLVLGFDRLQETLACGDGPAAGGRLQALGLRYREFALANPHFYAVMFGDAIQHDSDSGAVEEHALAALGALVRQVELAAAAGIIIAADPAETAQQLWSAIHGAVSLELKNLVQTPDPAASYRAFLDTLLRGLVPPAPA